MLLVERDRRAVAACRANAALVNRARGADVVRVRAGSVEQALAAEAAPVDLILADPPYPVAGPPLEAVVEAAAERLAPGGLLVLERAARDAAPRRPRGLEEVEVRVYGETALYLWQDER